MAIRNKEFLLETIKKYTGEDTSDETLQLIEDFTDTINDMDQKAETDWKQKYDENDKMWRDKYKARFFSNDAEVEQAEQASEETTGGHITDVSKLEYKDLFKQEV